MQKQLAFLPQRVLNFLIDYTIIHFCIGIMQPAFGYEGLQVKTLDDLSKVPLSYFVFTWVAQFVYYFCLEYFSGTTVGKLLTGTYVVAANNINKAAATAIRCFVRSIPLYPIICFFTGQVLLHDQISRTRVLRKPLVNAQ